jgi:membrane protein DedA with SNARE-associated domain
MPTTISLFLLVKTHIAISSASLNILQLLQNALNTFGYPAVVLFVMIESSGIPFPGETMLLLAAFYAAVDHHLQIPFVIACAAFGAIAGDNLGYIVGRTGGTAIIQRYGRFLFLKPERIEQVEQFFARHGDKTVFFGRFVAVLRTWAAFLAGVNKMSWKKFALYNAAGSILWAFVYGLLGYVAGRVFHNFGSVEHLASHLSLLLSVVIVLGAGIIFFIYKRRKN